MSWRFSDLVRLNFAHLLWEQGVVGSVGVECREGRRIRFQVSVFQVAYFCDFVSW